jgi:hypothetical protein
MNPKKITADDRFANLVLNTPAPVVGEIMGIKLVASPLLAGSGISIMGRPGDPDPKNYAILVSEDPQS